MSYPLGNRKRVWEHFKKKHVNENVTVTTLILSVPRSENVKICQKNSLAALRKHEQVDSIVAAPVATSTALLMEMG